MRYSLSLLTLGSLMLLFAPAYGQFYQYTDKNGNVVFTDKPPAGSDAREKRLKGDVYRSNRGAADHSAPEDEAPSSAASRQSEQQKKDYSRVTVVMYMADWCGYCKKAREYIRSLGADLIEYNIDKDRSRKDEMKQKSGGSTAVPLLDIEGTIIRGYNPGAIKAALDRNAR